LWWLGQSGFLVELRGAGLVIDPYLSDSLTAKYAGSERPHVRMTRRVVDPRRLDGVVCLTASHGHTDHLDAETLRPLLAANPAAVLVAPRATRRLVVERSGIEPVGVGDGDIAQVGPFRLTALPAAHEQIELDERGDPRCLALVVEAGPYRLF